MICTRCKAIVWVLRGFGASIYVAQMQSRKHWTAFRNACHVQHIQQYLSVVCFVRQALADMLHPSTQAHPALFTHYLASCSPADTVVARGEPESTAVSDRQINKAGTICCSKGGAAV